MLFLYFSFFLHALFYLFFTCFLIYIYIYIIHIFFVFLFSECIWSSIASAHPPHKATSWHWKTATGHPQSHCRVASAQPVSAFSSKILTISSAALCASPPYFDFTSLSIQLSISRAFSTRSLWAF